MNSLNRAQVDFDPSPIDLIEDCAERYCWDVDRMGEDQIAMAVDGAWRSYSISLAWFEPDETLRMVCTYDQDVEADNLNELYRTIEAANDRLWTGSFNYWREQRLIAFRYGLNLRGGAAATFEQMEAMLRAAVESSERYCPVFQLVAMDGATTEGAMRAALLEAAGRA